MRTDTGTTIRRRGREEARFATSLLLASASGLIFYGLRKALTSEPDFSGSVVLITGGSRGLGLALAEEFRRSGAHVALIARDGKELHAARLRLLRAHRSSREVILLPADVSNEQAVRQAVADCLRHFGKIDVLVNNAGVIQVGAIATQTLADFRYAMDVNFWGVVNTTLAVLPHLLERNSGRIVNITSIGAKISMPHLLPYNASKFAALGFSLGLRSELARSGVSVTTIVPGLMRTGSYMNATFKGDVHGEYSWFSLSSSLPGLSISARRAAREIVTAAWDRKAEAILGMPAKAAGLLYSLLPGLGASVLGLINAALPAASGSHARLGRDSRTVASESFATALGKKAAERYNQHAKFA